jgi:hypothetical protein
MELFNFATAAAFLAFSPGVADKNCGFQAALFVKLC